ncbi:MAG: pantoate--beta-alanine ligase [bacterium]
MEIIKTIAELQSKIKKLKLSGRTVGFVPTMGYLHEGHLTLVREAKKSCDVVVVSIFVNPLQFGPKEDFSRYPRDFERDCGMLEKEKVDIVFAPESEEMYKTGFQTFVEVTEVTKTLCGASRPGHFRGVTTVVLKLFNAVMPDKAFFGMKDFQQLVTVERMVKDLNLDLEVVGVPIVREKDGLAMSSRNTYLSEEERRSALSLNKSLEKAKELVGRGERDVKVILGEVTKIIKESPFTKIDYVKICNPETLGYIEEGMLKERALLALAVFVGKTRLIDNTLLEV